MFKIILVLIIAIMIDLLACCIILPVLDYIGLDFLKVPVCFIVCIAVRECVRHVIY